MGSKRLFLGTLFSILLHGSVLLLLVVMGPGARTLPKQPSFIEGELVSMRAPQKRKGRREVKVVKKAPAKQKKQAPKKKSPKPKIKKKVTQKKPVKPKIKKKVIKKKQAKPKKTVTKKVYKEIEKAKKAIPLKTVKKSPKKKPKKRVAEKPSPKPVKIKQTPKTNGFEDVRQKLLEEMRHQLARREVEKKVAEMKKTAKSITPVDSSSTGGGRGLGSNTMLARLYGNRIVKEIRGNWGMPANIPVDGTLTAEISFRVNARGEVRDAKVVRSSGNTTFDNFCVEAILRASPITPPPPELAEEAWTEGLQARFSNRQ